MVSHGREPLVESGSHGRVRPGEPTDSLKTACVHLRLGKQRPVTAHHQPQAGGSLESPAARAGFPSMSTFPLSGRIGTENEERNRCERQEAEVGDDRYEDLQRNVPSSRKTPASEGWDRGIYNRSGAERARMSSLKGGVLLTEWMMPCRA